MQQDLVDVNKNTIKYELGSEDTLQAMFKTKSRKPFDEEIIEFLNSVSKELLSCVEARRFPEIVTLAFWIRKASMLQLKERYYERKECQIRIGRGVVFHIAPSNVPVNYAYSLVAGLISGNKNIIRVPSKEFEQIKIIDSTIKKVLKNYNSVANYICLIRYGHDKDITDYLSRHADVRVIWGGDKTIEDIRKSPLRPRTTEITFADRFSFSVIDSNCYLESGKYDKVAKDFYNDTYLTDQNACTSPRVVVWVGNEIEKAKIIFWDSLSKLVCDKYEISGVQAINKLTSGYMYASCYNTVRTTMGDNLIVRMRVDSISSDLIEYKENSGFFFEYDCRNIDELQELCEDPRVQTISYIGDKEMFASILENGVGGIDRIVPIGKTMDFDLIWDGLDLIERLTRVIYIG